MLLFLILVLNLLLLLFLSRQLQPNTVHMCMPLRLSRITHLHSVTVVFCSFRQRRGNVVANVVVVAAAATAALKHFCHRYENCFRFSNNTAQQLQRPICCCNNLWQRPLSGCTLARWSTQSCVQECLEHICIPLCPICAA